MKKSLAHSVWECKYHNESVKDDYDSNMDKDPFKGASNKEEDTDKQIAINLNTWPQISAFARVGLPLRGVSNNALIGRNQATGSAGGHDSHVNRLQAGFKHWRHQKRGKINVKYKLNYKI